MTDSKYEAIQAKLDAALTRLDEATVRETETQVKLKRLQDDFVTYMRARNE